MDMNARLVEALESHAKWLEDESSGERFVWAKYKDIEIKGEFVSANLTNADFTGADLRKVRFDGARLNTAIFVEANLNNAIFNGADLRMANFEMASLIYVSMQDANLKEADFIYANLFGADLEGADLRNVDFSYANLAYVDLGDADLTNAKLFKANLFEAYLGGTNLTQANCYLTNLRSALLFQTDFSRTDLRKADIMDATFHDVKNIDTALYNDLTVGFVIACPEEGSYIGFKKATDDKIIKLEIPADALRSSAASRKCRASKAKVLSITELDGSPSDVDSVASWWEDDFIYKVGETVEVKDFDTNRWEECSTGIHHFLTRDEAVKYSV